MENTLTLKHINVVFIDLEDRGFGKSVTVDVTDSATRKEVEDWAKEQGVTVKIKQYENKEGTITHQANFKLSQYTNIAGLGEEALGRGSVINMVVRPFEYSNKFGKGKSCSVMAMFVVEGKKSSVMDSISE